MLPQLDAFAERCRQLAPRLFIVLGSGQGLIGARITQGVSLPFGELPGMPAASVAGHKGCFTVGLLGDSPVILAEGRIHGYEGHPEEVITLPVRFAAQMGARAVLLTNAAGGIRDDLSPGALMPLNGQMDWRAARFPPPPTERNPYCPRLLGLIVREGRLWPGVYAALSGPSYETPAEIRALRACGADAVGMSTAPEARAAAELGMRCAAISLITNRAAGLSSNLLSHHDVLAVARASAERLAGLIEKTAAALGRQVC
jgi:purine-nucleoside phosphorylase